MPATVYQARVVVTKPDRHDLRRVPDVDDRSVARDAASEDAAGADADGYLPDAQELARGRLAQISRQRKPPVGTTFSVTLNEVAAVRLDFTSSSGC